MYNEGTECPLILASLEKAYSALESQGQERLPKVRLCLTEASQLVEVVDSLHQYDTGEKEWEPCRLLALCERLTPLMAAINNFLTNWELKELCSKGAGWMKEQGPDDEFCQHIRELKQAGESDATIARHGSRHVARHQLDLWIAWVRKSKDKPAQKLPAITASSQTVGAEVQGQISHPCSPTKLSAISEITGSGQNESEFGPGFGPECDFWQPSQDDLVEPNKFYPLSEGIAGSVTSPETGASTDGNGEQASVHESNIAGLCQMQGCKASCVKCSINSQSIARQRSQRGNCYCVIHAHLKLCGKIFREKPSMQGFCNFQGCTQRCEKTWGDVGRCGCLSNDPL